MGVEQEIWQAIVDANRAWVGGDADAAGALFHDDVVMAVPGSSRRLRGRAAVVRSYADHIRRVKTLAFEERDHGVDVTGDVAVAAYRFFTRYEVNGTVGEELGREILVFARGDRGWLAVWRTRLSVSPAEAASPFDAGGDGE
jgi:ketosteroid isomerase-like protein